MPIGSLQKRQNMFLAIEEFSRRRYILVFVLIAVVMAGSALLGSRIHLDTDILALVPQGDRAVDAFKESLRSFGAADYIAVMIEAPEERRAMDFSEFADRFVERVSEIDGVESVEDRLNPGSEMLSLFRKYALLFLPPDELPKLREKLSDEAIREQVRRDRRILLNPASPLTKELVRNDPLGLGPLVWKHLVKAQAALQFKTGEEGYYLSKDGSALLVLIKPTLPAQDLGFAERLVGDLHEAEARTREELAGDLGGLQDVSVSYAGTYIVGLDDSNLIKSDMKLTALVSFVGILALYYIGYRRFGALVYSSAPLIVGQAMTFAVAYLVFGTLNSASSGFVAMVMGLGTDFTIVMYARYVEERLRGESLAEASRKMMGEGGLGMFTGAITSAGTFYAMCVTRFRGLWEMGFLIGTGILLSMVAIVFMLPAMIQWNEGSRRRKELMKRLHVQSFGFEHLIPLAVRRPAVTLAALAIVTAFAGFAAWNIGFSDDIADLRSPENKGIKAQKKLREKFGADLNSMIVMVRGSTVDEAVKKARGVVAAAQPFLAQAVIRGTDSIVEYLPPPERQERLLAALRKGRDGDFDVDRVERTFRRASRESGFREDAFDDYLADFRALMTRAEPLRLGDLKGHNLGGLLQRYVKQVNGPEGPFYEVAVYLFLEEGRWRREPPPHLVEALENNDPAITVTGVNVISKRLRDIFARDAKLAISVGLVLVSILLWLDFRSFRLMMVANVQVLTGVVWMLGAMSVAGMNLNFVNAFVATMILGVGVDYGIHLIHRMCLNGGVVDRGVLETAKGVAMASMTNLLGFGALALSNYPGLRTVGIISVVGSLACLITALTLLPAMMSLRGFNAAVQERPRSSPADP